MSLEYGIQFQTWGFIRKNGITKHVWYSFQSQCLLLNVTLNIMLVLYAKPGIKSQTWYSMHDGPTSICDIQSQCWHSMSSLGSKSKALYWVIWCLVAVNVLWLFLMVPWVDLQYVIVVFPDHTHLFPHTLIVFSFKKSKCV